MPCQLVTLYNTHTQHKLENTTSHCSPNDNNHLPDICRKNLNTLKTSNVIEDYVGTLGISQKMFQFAFYEENFCYRPFAITVSHFM